jgi:hypothetical protein
VPEQGRLAHADVGDQPYDAEQGRVVARREQALTNGDDASKLVVIHCLLQLHSIGGAAKKRTKNVKILLTMKETNRKVARWHQL